MYDFQGYLPVLPLVLLLFPFLHFAFTGACAALLAIIFLSCRPACYHISILFIKKFNIENFFSQNGATAVIIGSGIRSIEYPINENPLLYGGII